MATTKKNSSDLNDDLLSLDSTPEKTETPASFETIVETPVEAAPAPDLTPVVEDDEAAEIAALKAALAQPLPTEAELTPQQQELRDLRDQMAQRQAQIAEQSSAQYEEVQDGQDSILIHILQDGFTINGLVTYRGQEFEFPVGGQAYQQTLNRHGKSWLDLTEEEQEDRWTEARFGHGKWPFKKLARLTLADLPEGSTPADLEAVKRAAARNDRRAPINLV